MRRWLWGCAVLLLVGCGGHEINSPATQTRTSEVVALTVAAFMLPTQNAAVPPTPVPTPIPSQVNSYGLSIRG